MIHVTVGSPRNNAMLMLEESAKRHGIDHRSITTKDNRKICFLDKFILMNDFIKTNSFSANSIIIFTDAYDTMICSDAASIHRSFLKADCDIYFNAEKTFWPPVRHDTEHEASDAELKKLFDDASKADTRYLNSGCYVGYVGAVTRLLEYCVEKGKLDQDLDDQRLARNFFKRSKEFGVDVKLDTESDLFGTLSNALEEYQYISGSVYNKSRKSFPSILHANGNKQPVEAFMNLNAIQRMRPEGIDLYVLQADGRTVAHNANDKTLEITDSLGDYCFLVRSSRRGGIVLSNDGLHILSFSPHRSVALSKHIDEWEVVSMNRVLHDHHGDPVQARASDGSLHPVRPAPLTLEGMMSIPVRTIENILARV